MKQLSVLLINALLLISSIRNENNFDKAWQSICTINSCESTLKQCISIGCFGKANCKGCVEDFLPTCSRCVDAIFDETAQITLPDNRKAIACDSHNQLHTTVCNFYCTSLSKSNYKCEVIGGFPVCDCFETAKSTAVITTTSTTPTTTTTTPTITTPLYPISKNFLIILK
jgi:hypothetical protein